MTLKTMFLPYSLKISAKTTEIDNIEVIPIYVDSVQTHTIKIYRFKNYEDKLIDKAISYINKDIKSKLIKNKMERILVPSREKVKFYVYKISSEIYNKGLYKCIDLKYDVK